MAAPGNRRIRRSPVPLRNGWSGSPREIGGVLRRTFSYPFEDVEPVVAHSAPEPAMGETGVNCRKPADYLLRESDIGGRNGQAQSYPSHQAEIRREGIYELPQPRVIDADAQRLGFGLRPEPPERFARM